MSADPSRGCATLGEVAVELGVSTQRAQQIERKALRKLRKALERCGLTFDDLCPPKTEGWPQHVAPVDFRSLPTTAAPRRGD